MGEMVRVAGVIGGRQVPEAAIATALRVLRNNIYSYPVRAAQNLGSNTDAGTKAATILSSAACVLY